MLLIARKRRIPKDMQKVVAVASSQNQQTLAEMGMLTLPQSNPSPPHPDKPTKKRRRGHVNR